MTFNRFLILTLLVLATACNKRGPFADKVVLGKIWTGQDSMIWAEGMAIIGDSIVAVGDATDIGQWVGDKTEKIEPAPGTLIVPGFIDCHTHFIEGGMALSSLKLRNAKSKAEFISIVTAYAKSIDKGSWITFGDWDHENWGGELPSRDWIDSVTVDKPMWINRLDGHMCLANSAALKIAGITDKVKNVAGGTIVRDSKGRLTGIFKDNAMSLVEKAVPKSDDGQEDQALEAAMKYVAEQGVTSIHNMSGYNDVFERAHNKNALKTRIYAGMMLGDWKLLNEKIRQDGKGDNWLRRGTLKDFVDGSLGSHTAAFFKPFDDTPKDSGFFIQKEDDLYRKVKAADSAGLQVMVHAIGDKAIHTLLNVYDRVAKENGSRDRRFRIEHAQHIGPDDLARFASQHVIPSMQPYHAIDDGRWAEKVIGHERSKTTYAFRSLIAGNAQLVFGSDWFVAPATPLEGIYAAVTRRTLDGKNDNGWIPEQKITVDQALRAYTTNAAFASFEENVKGSLAPGKLADFVVLEKDITAIPAPEIKDVKVLLTVVGGNTVFQK